MPALRSCAPGFGACVHRCTRVFTDAPLTPAPPPRPVPTPPYVLTIPYQGPMPVLLRSQRGTVNLTPNQQCPGTARSQQGPCQRLGSVPQRPRSPGLWLGGGSEAQRQCLLSHQAKSTLKCPFEKGPAGEQCTKTWGAGRRGEGREKGAQVKSFTPACSAPD